jgi:RecA/RadA recombinase
METSVNIGAMGQLSVFPDETAKALFRRKAGRPIDLGISALSALPRPGRSALGVFPGDVIEVYGESGSGKTEVLLHAVAHVLLPFPSTPPRLVVYFDHECRLDLARLELLLKRRLSTSAESCHGNAEARRNLRMECVGGV